MVAIFILLLGVLGVATMAENANVASDTAKARVGATNLAREVLEDARSFDYADLRGSVPAGSDATLQNDFINVGLTDANLSQSGYQIKRRGITYTISIFTCVMDDSHDNTRAAVGAGQSDTNSAGPYCLGSAAAGSTSPKVDANPDDFRKLEVSVTWTFSGRTPDCKNAGQTTAGGTGGLGTACVTQSELIANPSGGLGPAIAKFGRIDATGNYTSAAVEGTNTVRMRVQTTSIAQSVTWTADDGQSGAASPHAGDTTGTDWDFTWTLGSSTPKDGTHTVSAQAFVLTAGGVAKDAPVLLNRFIPGVPQTQGGGIDTRNGVTAPAAVISWFQNANENDIIGYTVYRASGSAPNLTGSPPDTPVCSTASPNDTLCLDASSNLDSIAQASTAACPAGAPAGDKCLDYYVVPFDSMWTTGNLTSYGATECPGTPWGTVSVPTPPVPAGSSIAPLTGSASWGQARAGCPSAFIVIDYTAGLAHTAPAAPTATAPPCGTSADGLAVIHWTPPASGTQYRIYRDPAASPPAYTAAATAINFGPSSFTDPNPTGGTTHNYYVTTVDAQFAESQPLQINWSPAGCP